MHLSVQQKLADYVHAGGHLVLLPHVPEMDERMNPAPGPLASLFPARLRNRQRGTRAGRLTPRRAVSAPALGVERAPISDYVDTFDLPPEAEAFAFEANSGQPCAYTVRHGAGKATLLGFKLRYQWDPQANLKRLVNGVLDLANVTRPAFAEGWELIASLRRGEAGNFLFVANPSDVTQCARIYHTDESGKAHSFPQRINGVTFPRRGGLILQVDTRIPGTNAQILYCTSQVQVWEAHEGAIRLKLYAHPGVSGEAAFRLPVRPALVAANGLQPEQVEWDEASTVLTVVFRHSGEYLELEIH
jgi:hypothetical protein